MIFLFLLGTIRTELGRHISTQVLLLSLSDYNLGGSNQQVDALDHSHKDYEAYVNRKTLTGVSKLLASLYHTGKRVVLGHTLSTL